MLVSTQIEFLTEHLSYEEALRMLKKAGFPAYDASLFLMKHEDDRFNGPAWREEAKKLRNFADDIGIVCNQSHAPFPSSFVTWPEKNPERYAAIVRSIEITSILGAKVIVVHPMVHLSYPEHTEELFDINVDFYKGLMPHCEKFGIKVALENTYMRHPVTKTIIDTACSRAWEFCKYIDAVDSEWMTGCIDIGHTSLVGADLPEFIRAVGPRRLLCLHVHDTNCLQDSHTVPFSLGGIDFIGAMDALREIGYRGDITLEADKFLSRMPEPLWQDACHFMFLVAEHLKSLAE